MTFHKIVYTKIGMKFKEILPNSLLLLLNYLLINDLVG